jgi:hypothetical protein
MTLPHGGVDDVGGKVSRSGARDAVGATRTGSSPLCTRSVPFIELLKSYHWIHRAPRRMNRAHRRTALAARSDIQCGLIVLC